MKKYIFSLRAKTLNAFVLSVFALTIISSCDNSTGNDDEHDHGDPFGIELIHDGEVLIRYFDNEVTELEHHHYHVGEEYHFDVEFLAEDGDHIHADDFEDSYNLDWDISDDTVLEIEQHTDEGRWSFHLVPLSEGEVKVQFLLNHGDHDHFKTPKVASEDAIEFHVEEGEHEDGDHDH